MNIFEYIDKKRVEYESLRDDSKLQFKKNQNRIQKISIQIEQMTEEEENPSQFFLPESSENYKEEIKKLQEKIQTLESENEILDKKIELCENEIYLLDTLELPDFSSAKNETEWKPMRVPEEEIQNKIVSRETMNEEIVSGVESKDAIQNVSRETFCNELSQENVSRETMANGESDGAIDEQASRDSEILIDKNLIREKICFCRKISELDPRRCALMLDEIIYEIL